MQRQELAARPELVDTEPGGVVALNRAETDTQIATARSYPRIVKVCLETAREMALLDEETAAACYYALPPRRGSDEPIEGPSIRLAEIMASAWGHMRLDGRILEEGKAFLVARGAAWDLQTNTAYAAEVRRRITNREHARYSQDMIGMTANAAISIAIRNAVFSVVPRAYVEKLWRECKARVAGDQRTVADRAQKAIRHFAGMGVSADRVYAALGLADGAELTGDHVGTLQGYATSIREGTARIDDVFPPFGGGGADDVAMPQRRAPAPAADAPRALPPPDAAPDPVLAAARRPDQQPAAAPRADDPPPDMRAVGDAELVNRPAAPAAQPAPPQPPRQPSVFDGAEPAAPTGSPPHDPKTGEVLVSEQQRLEILGAAAKRGKTNVDVNAWLYSNHGIPTTAEIPESMYAEVIHWARNG